MTLQLLPPARELREPTWWATPGYVYTLGPEVAEVCALAGYAPEPEQQLLLDHTFGVAENGKSAAFEVDVIAARRALKTGFVIQAILGWLFVTHERKVMYTAHDLDAARETWDTIANLIEQTPALAAHLQPSRGDRPGIVEGNGRWAIVLRAIPSLGIPKRRVIFKTRGKSTGRALSGNKLIIDEAFAATQRQVGSVLPILGAEPDPQVVFASSAGMVDSDVLIDSRDRGRDGGSRRQVYAEWGDRNAGTGCQLGEKCDHAKPPNAPPGCALDDEARWAEIIPTLGYRVGLDTIRALRATMPPLEFAREFMVWWDVDGTTPQPPIALEDWRALTNRKAKAPSEVCLFLDVAPDRSTSTVALAGRGRSGRTLVVTKTFAGTARVVPYVEKLVAKRDVVEVALATHGQAAALIPALTAADIEYEAIGNVEQGQACAWIQTAIEDGLIEHVGQPELDAAVENGRIKQSREAQFWDRADWSIDITPLVGITGAAWRWANEYGDDVDSDDSIY